MDFSFTANIFLNAIPIVDKPNGSTMWKLFRRVWHSCEHWNSIYLASFTSTSKCWTMNMAYLSHKLSKVVLFLCFIPTSPFQLVIHFALFSPSISHSSKTISYPFSLSLPSKIYLYFSLFVPLCGKVFLETNTRKKTSKKYKLNPRNNFLYHERQRARIKNKPKQIIETNSKKRSETTIFPNDEKTNIRPNGKKSHDTTCNHSTDPSKYIQTNTKWAAASFFLLLSLQFFFCCDYGLKYVHWMNVGLHAAHTVDIFLFI